MTRLCVAIACGLTTAGVALLQGAAPEKDAGVQALVIPLNEANAIEAFQQIIQSTRFPISFESPSLDPKTQGLTARQLENSLGGEEKASTLSEGDRARLSNAVAVAKDAPNSIVDWKIPRITAQISSADPQKILAQFCVLYPDYQSVVTNGHFLLIPKVSELDFPMEPISVKNKSLSDVLTSVSSQFEKRKITFVSLGRSDVLNRKIEALELPSASAREFLTRLVQAAGPDVVWFLGGMKGSRALTISTL